MIYCFPNFFVNFWQHFFVNLFSIFGETEVSLESTCTFLQGYQDCVRGLTSSLSLYISVCVCVGLVFQSLFCVCVCGGGHDGGIIPLLDLKIISYFPYLLLFFDDIPPPCNSYKAAPISSSLCNVYVCVCVCVCACVFVTFYLCTSYFNRVAKFFGLLVFMYKYILIINLYKWHLSKKVWQLCIARMSEV